MLLLSAIGTKHVDLAVDHTLKCLRVVAVVLAVSSGPAFHVSLNCRVRRRFGGRHLLLVRRYGASHHRGSH